MDGLYRKWIAPVTSHQQRMLAALLLLLLVSGTECLNITKCCKEGLASIDFQYLSCRPALSGRPPFQVNTPKIFSLLSEEYVSQPFQVTSTGIPQCGAEEVITSISLVGDEDEQFVLLAEEETLFVSKDSSTHSNYCVDDVQSSGLTIGSVSLTLAWCAAPSTVCPPAARRR